MVLSLFLVQLVLLVFLAAMGAPARRSRLCFDQNKTHRDHRRNRAGDRSDAPRGRPFYREWRAGLSSASAAHRFGAARDRRARQRYRACRRSKIAIVGARNASAAGLTFTSQLPAELPAPGMSLFPASPAGSMHGRIRRRSRPDGRGRRGGTRNIYPAEHEALLERILEHGAAISEMPFGWEARGGAFNAATGLSRAFAGRSSSSKRRAGPAPHHREIRR